MAQACPASSMFWLISASNFDLFPLLFFLSLFFLCFTKRVTVTVLHDICIKNRWYKHKYLQARATYFTWIVMWNKQSELHYFSLRIWKSEFLTIMCSSDTAWWVFLVWHFSVQNTKILRRIEQKKDFLESHVQKF